MLMIGHDAKLHYLFTMEPPLADAVGGRADTIDVIVPTQRLVRGVRECRMLVTRAEE